MSISINELKQGVDTLSSTISKSKPTTEFEYRNYCSKSYYAIYHLVKEFLNDRHDFDQAVANGAYHHMGTHKIIITFLDEHIHIPNFNHNRDYKKLVYRLKSMRQGRVDADYYLNVNVTEIAYIQSKGQYEGVISIIGSI